VKTEQFLLPFNLTYHGSYQSTSKGISRKTDAQTYLRPPIFFGGAEHDAPDGPLDFVQKRGDAATDRLTTMRRPHARLMEAGRLKRRTHKDTDNLSR
jgi:hypothetical protein